MTKLYLATKDEIIRAYKSLAEISPTFAESTSLTDIFHAMATPSRLACTITNGSVYPASGGTLTMSKTGVNTGTATFVDAEGRMSTGVFPWSGWQSPGYSNPNLLINWDFRNPVNQRGQSSYTNSGYCIDMWDNVGGSHISLIDSGVRIVNNTNEEKWFTQKTEIKSSTFLTNQYTFSAKIDEAIYALVLDGVQGGKVIEGKYITLYSNLSEDYAAFFFAIYPGCDAVISCVKLEVGTVSTLALDIKQPSDYAAELRKCQRYFIANNGSPICGYGVINGSGERAFITIPLPTEMRTIPTLLMKKFVSIRVNGAMKTAYTSISAWNSQKDPLALHFDFTGDFMGLSNQACVLEGLFEASAEP